MKLLFATILILTFINQNKKVPELKAKDIMILKKIQRAKNVQVKSGSGS
jgi:hypothetical protein